MTFQVFHADDPDFGFTPTNKQAPRFPEEFTKVATVEANSIDDVFRITNHIDFPDYSVDELVTIAKMMLEEQQYQLTPQAEIALTDYITRRKQKPLFANARSIKNALDRARMRQANRIFDSRGQVLTKKELVNLEADDFLQSTIFN